MHKCCLLWLLCNCCMVIYGESDTQFSPGDERHRKKFVEAVLKSDASDDPNLENQLKERHDLKYNGLPKPQIVKHFKNSFYPSGTPKKFFDTLNRKRVSGNKGNNIQIERGSSLQRISDVLRMIKLDYQKWPLEEMTVREKELVKKDKNNNDFRYDVVKGKPNSELFQPKAIHLTHNSIKSAKQNIRPYNRSAGSDRHQSNKPNSYRRLPLDREKRNTTNLKQTRYNENIAQLKGRKFDQDPKSTMLLNNLKSRLRQSELVKIVENQKKENELLKKRHLQNLAKIDDILNTEINQSNDINRSGDKSSELISLEKCIDTLNFNPVDGKIGHALVEPFIVSNITSEGTSKIYKLTPRSSNSNTSYIILPVPKFSEDGSTNQFNYFINEILTDIRRISKRAAEYSPGLLRGKILRNNNEQYSSNLNVSLDVENSWQNHWNKTANEIYRHSENPNLLNKFTCIHEADQNIDSARGSNKRKEDVNTGCEHSRKESKRNVHIKEVNNMHQYLDFDSKNKLPFDKPISHGKNNEDESDISHWHWNENGHKTDEMVDAKKQSKSMYNQSYKKGFSTRNALKQSNRYLRKINPLHAKSVEKTTCSASTEYAEGAEESTEEIVSSKQEVALSTEAPKSAASTTEVSSKTETTEYHGTEGNKLEQTSEAFKPEPEQENLKPEQGPTTVQNKPEPRPEPEGHKPETEPEPLPSGQGGSEGVGQGEATTPPGHPTQTQGEHDEFGGIGNTQDKGVGPSGGQGKGGGNVGTLGEAPSTQQAPGGNETEPMPETDRASTTPPNELLDLSCKLIHSDPSKSVETVQLKCFQGKKKTVGRHASRHPKRRRNAVRLHGQKFRVGRAIAREHDPHVTTNQKDNEHLRKTISIEIQKKPNELKTQYKKHRKRFGPSEAKKQYDKGTPKGPKRHERFNHFGFDRIIGCSQMTKKTPVHYENYFRPKNTRPYYYE